MEPLLSGIESGAAAAVVASLLLREPRKYLSFVVWLSAFCALSFLPPSATAYAVVSTLALGVVIPKYRDWPLLAAALLAGGMALPHSAIAAVYISLFAYCALAGGLAAVREENAKRRLLLEGFAAWHLTQFACLFALWVPRQSGLRAPMVEAATLLSIVVFAFLAWRLNSTGLEGSREEETVSAQLSAVSVQEAEQ